MTREGNSIDFHLFVITGLNDAVGFHSLPLQIVVADYRLAVRQDSVVLARERALRSPNVRQVALHFDAFVLRDVSSTTPYDDFEF